VEPVAAGEGGGFDRLEPYEVKISRTVLRGLGSGDTAWLPDEKNRIRTAPGDKGGIRRVVRRAGESGYPLEKAK
ncbi:MAG: hypothetical protein ABSC19_20950, partial [Syntrophorhabdales bacterium]